MLHAMGLGVWPLKELDAAEQVTLRSIQNADPASTVSIANALWFDQGATIVPSFQSNCAEYFGAGVTRLNFADASASATVNGWVSDATHGKIAQIVDPKDLRGMAAVLTNAIYFKGDWSAPFEKAATRDAPFYLTHGQQKTVPLMYRQARMLYADTKNLQVVAQPYGNGRLQFLVALPHKGTTVDAALNSLDGDSWLGVTSQLSYRNVELHLPRFKAHYRKLLNDPLKAMGMGSAFDRRADFLDMSPDVLCISKVIHVAVLEVDEKGTVAAASTAITMKRLSLSVERPERAVVVRVDHPFLAFIRDTLTGRILFAGVINNPE
jgi:serpin B